MAETLSTCITCGQSTGEPPRLNRLPGGEPCPLCHDRLLDSLPPVLPFARGGLRARDPRDPIAEDSPDAAAQRAASGPRLVMLTGGLQSAPLDELPDQPA